MDEGPPHANPRRKLKRGYLWATLALFLLSLAGQFWFSWRVYVSEQEAHDEPLVTQDYLDQTFKDMLENWQSEFLQLCWQVAGLAMLWYIGSPQSREGSDRKEEKLDLLLEKVLGKEEATRRNEELEQKYPKE